MRTNPENRSGYSIAGSIKEKIRVVLLAVAIMTPGHYLLAYPSGIGSDHSSTVAITVRGQVKGTDGTPLSDATVTEKGTSNAVRTDAGGNFTIQTDPAATLVVSYIGFQSVEVNVNNRTEITIELNIAISTGEEVVVVGYGSQKKASLTGSVYVVKMSDVKDQAVGSRNIVRAMDNRVPGITTSYDGNPNAAAGILMRGRGSLNSSTDPLVIIDGVPTNRGLNEIPVNDIESVQVLKDASSATIYGSRAANGVFIITTKSAKKGPRLEVNSSVTAGFLPKNPLPLMNTEEYGRAQWMAARNDNVDPNYGLYSFQDHQDGNGTWVLDKVMWPEFLDPAQTMRAANTDWQKEISRTALSQNHNVTMSNGSDKGTVLFSLDYLKSAGTTKHNEWNKLNLRLNSTYQFFNGAIKVGENFSVTKMRYTGGSWLGNTANIQSIVPVRTVDGIGWGGPVMGMSDRNNPLLDIMRERDNHSDDVRLLGSAFAEVRLLKNLSFRSTFGIDYIGNWGRHMTKTYSAGFMQETIAKVNNNAGYGGSWTWNNVLNYNFSLDRNNFQLMAGQEATEASGANLFGARDGYASEDPDYMYLNVGEGNVRNGGLAWDNAQNSYFGRINYDFDNRYLLTAIIRHDGSSRFGGNNRYATFPSVSAGWVISEEGFMKSIGWLSNLKLRYGWGKTGNQAIDNYASYELYQAHYGDNDWPVTNGTAYDIFGNDQGNLLSGYRRLQLGNPNLRWEATTQQNFGIDFAFFDRKLSGSVDYYLKTTSDILVRPPTLSVTGFGASSWINGATMKNRGIEAIVSYTDRAGSLGYTITANAYRNKNEFTSLVPEAVGAYPGNGRDQTILGRPLNSLYGYVVEGLFQTQEEVDAAPVQPGKGLGRLRYKDVSGPDGKPDGKIDADDRTWIGVNEPKIALGLNIQLTYKAFDFSMFWGSEIGRMVGSATKGFTHFFGFFGGQNYGKDVLNSWSPTNTSSTIPAITKADLNQENRFSTYFVENTSYMKLQNLSIGYTLPSEVGKRLMMNRARVFIQGDNLWTIALPGNTFTGFDPKSPAVGFPLPTSITFGVNVIF